jgi:hypothetical protein
MGDAQQRRDAVEALVARDRAHNAEHGILRNSKSSRAVDPRKARSRGSITNSSLPQPGRALRNLARPHPVRAVWISARLSNR